MIEIPIAQSSSSSLSLSSNQFSSSASSLSSSSSSSLSSSLTARIPSSSTLLYATQLFRLPLPLPPFPPLPCVFSFALLLFNFSFLFLLDLYFTPTRFAPVRLKLNCSTETKGERGKETRAPNTEGRGRNPHVISVSQPPEVLTKRNRRQHQGTCPNSILATVGKKKKKRHPIFIRARHNHEVSLARVLSHFTNVTACPTAYCCHATAFETLRFAVQLPRRRARARSNVVSSCVVQTRFFCKTTCRKCKNTRRQHSAH